MDKKKLGRPTDNPKPYQMSVKCDKERKEIIDIYCKKYDVSIMEAIRRGIEKLKDDL